MSSWTSLVQWGITIHQNAHHFNPWTKQERIWGGVMGESGLLFGEQYNLWFLPGDWCRALLWHCPAGFTKRKCMTHLQLDRLAFVVRKFHILGEAFSLDGIPLCQGESGPVGQSHTVKSPRLFENVELQSSRVNRHMVMAWKQLPGLVIGPEHESGGTGVRTSEGES